MIEERHCRRCGCTDEWACTGGCHWVAYDLCCRCVGSQRDFWIGTLGAFAFGLLLLGLIFWTVGWQP